MRRSQVMPDDHWLLVNFRQELQSVNPGLMFEMRNGFLLPDRQIITGSVILTVQQTLRDAITSTVLLYETPSITLCTVYLNTSLTIPLKLEDPNPNHMQFVTEIAEGLYQRVQNIVRMPTT